MASFKEAEREALEFLRTLNDVGMLATVDANGHPYLSPVYYAMGDGFELYVLTTKGTHKSKNIEGNDKVAFTVGVGPEYITVMLRGKAMHATSEEENKALPLLMEKLEKHDSINWPLRKLEDLRDQNLVLYKIVPEKVTLLNLNSKEEAVGNASHLYHILD